VEFDGAYVLRAGQQEPYRKFLPRLNSVCMSQTRRRVWEPFGREFTSSAEAPARGYATSVGRQSRQRLCSELPLRQGFAARNAWTPQSGGSLRSQERTGRSYKKFLPRLNSVCSLVSSPMV